jgi:hypothetical protein
MIQLEELNQVISEISEIYSKRVKEIVAGTLAFNSNELKELKHIRKQLNLLFEIRDNYSKVLEDLELFKFHTP